MNTFITDTLDYTEREKIGTSQEKQRGNNMSVPKSQIGRIVNQARKQILAKAREIISKCMNDFESETDEFTSDGLEVIFKEAIVLVESGSSLDFLRESALSVVHQLLRLSLENGK